MEASESGRDVGQSAGGDFQRLLLADRSSAVIDGSELLDLDWV